jgi:integrase
MRFCSERLIAPDAVDVAVFDRFHQALEERSLVKDPKQTYRTFCVIWNRASAEVAGWPSVQVAVPNHSRRYALAWDAFPPAFQADAEAYLNRRSNNNFFTDDYAKAAAPSTIGLRRNQILQIATALVQSGRSPDEITSLAVLVEPENAKRALLFFLEREDGKSATSSQGKAKSTTSIHDKAIFLRGLAKHWVKASEADCRKLDEYAKELGVKNRGMTTKNRKRLRQFDDTINVDALLGLTDRVLREVRRDDTGHRRDALRAMYAVAVGFLIAAPIRVKNLTSLEFERHLERVNSGGQPKIHLIIPEHEVKNGEPFEIALPAPTAASLTDYIKTYRSRISAKPSPWLFPNDDGGRRVTVAFSTSISKFILRETGIKMNVHLFRHLAAKLYLDAHPEDVETVRRLLGHKSVATTLRFYADLKTASCFRRYDAMVADLRLRADAAGRHGRRQGVRQ